MNAVKCPVCKYINEVKRDKHRIAMECTACGITFLASRYYTKKKMKKD